MYIKKLSKQGFPVEILLHKTGGKPRGKTVDGNSTRPPLSHRVSSPFPLRRNQRLRRQEGMIFIFFNEKPSQPADPGRLMLASGVSFLRRLTLLQ